MNSQPNKSRILKIELAGDVWRHKTFPKIRLQGKWLEQLGFKPNGRVRIVPLTDGELVLKLIYEETPKSPSASQLKDTYSAFTLDQSELDLTFIKTSELISSQAPMAFPTQHEVEVPLLRVIHELGGQAAPKTVYPKVAAHFSQLSEEDLSAKLPSSPSTFKWHNLVQWSRQALVDKEELDGSTRGIWKITAKGKQRLELNQGLKQEPLGTLVSPSNLKDLIYQNEAEVKSRILSELKGLTSKEFELSANASCACSDIKN